MTYNVFSGTLNPAQSINQPASVPVARRPGMSSIDRSCYWFYTAASQYYVHICGLLLQTK